MSWPRPAAFAFSLLWSTQRPTVTRVIILGSKRTTAPPLLKGTFSWVLYHPWPTLHNLPPSPFPSYSQTVHCPSISFNKSCLPGLWTHCSPLSGIIPFLCVDIKYLQSPDLSLDMILSKQPSLNPEYSHFIRSCSFSSALKAPKALQNSCQNCNEMISSINSRWLPFSPAKLEALGAWVPCTLCAAHVRHAIYLLYAVTAIHVVGIQEIIIE